MAIFNKAREFSIIANRRHIVAINITGNPGPGFFWCPNIPIGAFPNPSAVFGLDKTPFGAVVAVFEIAREVGDVFNPEYPARHRGGTKGPNPAVSGFRSSPHRAIRANPHPGTIVILLPTPFRTLVALVIPTRKFGDVQDVLAVVFVGDGG
jgi:hypothetical protein